MGHDCLFGVNAWKVESLPSSFNWMICKTRSWN